MSNATPQRRTRNGVPAASADLVPLAPNPLADPADHQGLVSLPPSRSSWTRPWTPASSPSARAAPGTPSPISPGGSPSQQANRLLGYGGWGYDLVGEVTPRDITTRDAQTGAVEHATAYTATVRLHVPGVPPRTDVGFQVVAEESAQGHETAYKGAVTDALKRALRTLGAQFGNDLAGDGGTGAADTWAASLRQTLLALGAQPGLRRGAYSARPSGSGWARTWTPCPPPSCCPWSQAAAQKLPPASSAERREPAS